MRHSAGFGLAILCAALCSEAAADTSLPRVPDGFVIEKVAASPLVQHPMMAGFDDRGRLFVAASSGKNLRSADLMKERPNFIRMLEDTDGDGHFDRSSIFADKMTLPMGALWYRGALYVASPPTIWRLEDTDDDGVADKRERVVNNFGFSGNAASVHGCFLGPEGRIYWCDGRHGHEFRDEQGQVTSGGLAARIFSCKPDGSDVRVFCGGGMDNPVEIDFMPSGEMLGTVNILLSKPRVDCLMHWLDGGAYPHYERAISELQKTGELLQPMTKLGHVAVSGMMRYRSDQFGPDFKNNVFITLFNTHDVIRSVITRSGATFTTREEAFLESDSPDFHPTDVLEDADGSLLVIDTGGWFRIGCPVSKVPKPDIHGAIYRIRRKNAAVVQDPRGQDLQLAQYQPAQLVGSLADKRPAVREQAIDLLAQQGAASIESLGRVLSGGRGGMHGVTARTNAVWALARIGDTAAAASLRDAVHDESEHVRIAAARSLGAICDTQAIAELVRLVKTDTPAVRREAANALGCLLQPRQKITESIAQSAPENIEARKREERFSIVPRISAASARPATVSQSGIRLALQSLFETLPSASTDRSLEHALIYAVIRIADRQETIPYLKHSNPQTRRAALISLDQMEGGDLNRQLVTPLLDTDDPQLQKTTLAVIGKHAGWADETLSLLQTWIVDSQLTSEHVPILRGFLLAQANDEKVQDLIATSLEQHTLQLPVRLLLLEVVDRCTLTTLPDSWIPRLNASLVHPHEKVRLQAIRIVQSRKLQQFDANLKALGESESETHAVRIEAIAGLAPRLKSMDGKFFGFLTMRLADQVSPLVKLTAARAMADAPLDDAKLLRLAGTLEDAGPLAAPVLLRAFTRSSDESVGLALVSVLNRSEVAANLSADELEMTLQNYPDKVRRSAQALMARLGATLQQQRATLTELSDLASGGDPQHGREVFFSKKSACASCHTVAGQGGKVGPDLSKVGGIRTSRDLLEAIALPSATFARGYRPYTIVTEQGRVFTGIISRQTADTLYLRTAELSEIRIALDSIEQMTESNTSIMPKGMEKTLSREDFRDLMAYLQARKSDNE